jgi:hypothetical protein
MAGMAHEKKKKKELRKKTVKFVVEGQGLKV